MPPFPDTAGLNTSLIYDAAESLNAGVDVRGRIGAGIRPIGTVPPVVGPAFTMRLSRAADTKPENRLAVMAAYDSVPAGSVLVIEVVGDLHGAVVGDVLAHRLKHKGVLGLVVDGPIRDVDGMVKYGPPSWASAVTMAGMKTVSVSVETGAAIRIGGVPVAPGDLVAGDADGVIFCPAAEVEALIAKAVGYRDAETLSHEKIEAGGAAASSYLPKP